MDFNALLKGASGGAPSSKDDDKQSSSTLGNGSGKATPSSSSALLETHASLASFHYTAVAAKEAEEAARRRAKAQQRKARVSKRSGEDEVSAGDDDDDDANVVVSHPSTTTTKPLKPVPKLPSSSYSPQAATRAFHTTQMWFLEAVEAPVDQATLQAWVAHAKESGEAYVGQAPVTDELVTDSSASAAERVAKRCSASLPPHLHAHRAAAAKRRVERALERYEYHVGKVTDEERRERSRRGLDASPFFVTAHAAAKPVRVTTATLSLYGPCLVQGGMPTELNRRLTRLLRRALPQPPTEIAATEAAGEDSTPKATVHVDPPLPVVGVFGATTSGGFSAAAKKAAALLGTSSDEDA